MAIIGALVIVVIDHIVGIGCIGAVELPLLGHVQASHPFGRIAEILLRLIPAVKGVAVAGFRLIHLIGFQVTGCHIVGVIPGGSAVGVDQVIIHRELIPDHADDVGPAVDGDGIAQLVIGFSSLVLIPAAVVVPAFELKAGGELVRLIVAVDVQSAELVLRADRHGIQRHRLVGLFGIAIAVDHQHNGLVFALGLEGHRHRVAGTLGNLPAVVIGEFHLGGGIAAVLMLHAVLFTQGIHIGQGIDGDGAGGALAGHAVAVIQKAGKGPVMFGSHGLALDVDVDEGIQLGLGGIRRVFAASGFFRPVRVERDVLGNGSLEIEQLAAIRSGIPSVEFITLADGVTGFGCRFVCFDRLCSGCARRALVVQIEGDRVRRRARPRIGLFGTLFTILIYADFHNVIFDLGTVHLTLIIADRNFNSCILFVNCSKYRDTLRFVKGNMRIGDFLMFADNIVIGNPVIWIIGTGPSVFPVIRVCVIGSFTVYLNSDTI